MDGYFRWGRGAVGDLLHWKRTEISVFISSLIPSPVIPFQRLPGQPTWAQTLITPFVFLSPIEELRLETGNLRTPAARTPPRFSRRCCQGSPKGGHA